jgi:tRNA pseudouridine55 synthase
MNSGIHLTHKPVGPTSFSFLQSLAHRAAASPTAKPGASAPGPRICHGGTLDPFASGLLLILVAPATKLFDYLHAVPKVYEATVRWSIETDNGDPHGRVIFEGDASSLTPERLDGALPTFIGWHDQTPHVTSAKRIAGERAYVKAHRGETFDMPPARVYLHEATWLSHDLPRASRIRIVCRGGYYVRALARDLGRSLGCGAHLTTLHRTAIGPWTDPGPGGDVHLQNRELLPWAPSRNLNDQEAGELRAGRTIEIGQILPPDWALPPGFPDPQPPIRAFHRERLTHLLRDADGRLKMLTYFPK